MKKTLFSYQEQLGVSSLLVSEDLVEGFPFPSEDRGRSRFFLSRFEVCSSKLSPPLTKRDKRSFRADQEVNGAFFFLEKLEGPLF